MVGASGDQHTITSGALRATVTEVGATLRELFIGDEPILWGFGADEISGSGRGQVLCPWPNRLGDGHFVFDGVQATAALDEPARNNAIHGLVRWLSWQAIEKTDSSVTLGCVLCTQPGYPFRLSLSITYTCAADGLVVRTTAHNEGASRAPFGLGFHPYLAAGQGGLDAASITVPARSHVVLDDRGLPTGTEVSERSPAPFAPGRSVVLRSIVLDDCYTDLDRAGGRNWAVRFDNGNGGLTRTLWGDASFDYVMCFTGDTLAEGDRRRGIAIEPMTCAPNALQSGDGLIVIEPNQSFSCEWGVYVG